MKRLSALILVLALVLSLLGCAAEDTPYVPSGDALAAEDADLNAVEEDTQKEPQEFSLAYYPDRSLNPFACTDYTNRTLFSLLYQSLFHVSSSYEAMPVLCSSYTVSSSSKTYTFYITDATFSDGTRLTANDVLVSYQTAQASAYYSGRFTHITEIALSEDGGIRFTLDTPMENLPLLLDIPIVKASQVEADRPLGTGPYVLEGTLAGYQLRKNYTWWCLDSVKDLAVYADAIPLVEAGAPNEIRDQFEFYDVGLVCADPCADNYAAFRCDYELWDCENGIMLYLGCNVAYSQNGIFEEPDLRALLTYAIDRELLSEEYFEGFARPVTLAASPTSPYYSTALASKYDYDPIVFINALSRAKQTDEPIRLLVNMDDTLRLRTARAIAKMLTDCGLETKTVEVNSRQFQTEYIKGTYDLYLGATKLSPNMDLTSFFKAYQEMSRNGVSNANLYELCLDALENEGNYYNLHKALADDGRIVPILFCSYAVYAERGLLTDLQPSRDNVFYYTLGKTAADVLITE